MSSQLIVPQIVAADAPRKDDQRDATLINHSMRTAQVLAVKGEEILPGFSKQTHTHTHRRGRWGVGEQR